jgi:hypothetical protein
MPKHSLRLVRENDLPMKRTDAFMLGMTAFVAANCISYFVLSRAPYVTAWGSALGHNYYEAIGFPFEILEELIVGGEYACSYYSWSSSSIALVANVVVAAIVSCFVARWWADRLPPLWSGYSRTSQYSLRGLLAVVTIVCLVLGIGTRSLAWALAVRNLTCFVGPVATYAWYLYRRQISWVWLAIAGVGLTLLALAMDFRYQDPPIRFVGLTAIRTSVPVFGLLSFLVIIHAADGRRCLRYLLDCLRWG